MRSPRLVSWCVALAIVGCAPGGSAGPDGHGGPGNATSPTSTSSTDAKLGYDATDPTSGTSRATAGTTTPVEPDPEEDRHPDEPMSEVFVSHRVLVRPAEGVTVEALAKGLGVDIETDAVSGWWSVAVPSSVTAYDFERELDASGLVDECSRVGRIEAAASLASMVDRAHPSQWHLAASRAPLPGDSSLATIVVAVLDTGVAYETYAPSGTEQYVQAPTLSAVEFVAPYDFVHDDPHPNDDNQHGTHITSLIASQGALEGVAAGVAIMPVKVLDEDNRGNELDLLRGLHHAIDNGADIINLSLSFPLGYVPSPALEEALQRAYDAGIVVVAASGNQGAGQITWPAASRLVIGVGAVEPTGGVDPKTAAWDSGPSGEAAYSNLSNALDVVAPGGVLDRDHTGDGVVDGMLAETIVPGDPSQTAWWLYAGTSQATAVVSGAVAHLLAAGADSHDVPALLQIGARVEGLERPPYWGGVGAGVLDIERALAVVKSGVTPAPRFTVGLLPHLKSGWGSEQPTAWVWVQAEGGLPGHVDVVGSIVTEEGSLPVVCRAHQNWGTCALQGPAYVDDRDDRAWQFVVEGVVWNGVVHRPTAAVYATDTAELLLRAIDVDTELSGSMMAFYFDRGWDWTLGFLESAWVVPNTGTGSTALPSAMLLQPGALPATPEVVDVDLDATGLLSSPFGAYPASRLRLGGGSLVAFEGTGLLSSPLKFHPTQFFGFGGTEGSGLLSSPLGFTGDLVDLGRRTSSSLALAGTLFGSALEGHGLTLESGIEAADDLVGSGAVSLQQGVAAPKGSGSGSLPLP